jgi:hypothetical protein
MRSLCVALFLSLMSLSAFAQTYAKISLTIDSVDHFEQMSPANFVGTRSSGLATIGIHVEQDGEVLYNFGDENGEAFNELNNSRIDVLDRHNLRYSDTERNTSSIVAAIIKGEFDGNSVKAIESIKINKANLRKIFEDVLREQALDVLNSFSLSTNDTSVKYEFNVNDYECLNLDKVLSCKTLAKVSLTIQSNE